MKYIFVLSLSCLLLSHCGTIASRPYSKKMNGIEVYSTKADLQTMYVKLDNSNNKICASRMADVADTKTSGIGLGASAGKYGKESFGDTSSSGAIDLGGRSSALLIIRELAYRSCELSVNFDLSAEEALTLFDSVLDASKEITSSTQGTGVSPLESVAGQSTIDVPEVKFETPSETSSSNDDSSQSDSDDDESED